MNAIEEFKNERKKEIKLQAQNMKLKESAHSFLQESVLTKYSYNFSWMGRPIIQYPQDMIAMQEIIYEIKPDLIIETGVAHGGSLIYYASLLELIGNGEVLGIDIDIREHNKLEILKHPMSKRIKMIQGSSVATEVVDQVKKEVQGKKVVMVLLDSNHTHEHVYQELLLYSDFVTLGSYLVVFDTLIEDMPKNFYPDRSWDKGNNPKTAIFKFLEGNKGYEIDSEIDNKLLISVANSGYLRKISN